MKLSRCPPLKLLSKTARKEPELMRLQSTKVLPQLYEPIRVRFQPFGMLPVEMFMNALFAPAPVWYQPASARGLSDGRIVRMLTVPPTELSESIEFPIPFWTWIEAVASERPIQLFQYMLPEVSPEMGIPFRRTEMFSCLKPLMLILASPKLPVSEVE